MNKNNGLGNYRDMQLLEEIAQSPHATQRDLAKNIGSALGLTNLMLRRLATKGYIKITSPKKGKIRYLLTRQGFLEKTRLTCEFISYSLHLYGRIRQLLHEQLSLLGESGKGRIVLYGTNELAEVAYLTIQEMGLKLVAVVSGSSQTHFLGSPVKKISQLSSDDYDRLVMVILHWDPGTLQQLIEQGVPADRIICVSFHGLDHPPLPQERHPIETPSREGTLDPSTIDVVVLCGGKGTRLGELTAQTPKPLLPVGRYPFLLRLLLQLEREGFARFVLACHYLPDNFRALLSTYGDLFPQVKLVVEPEPLGTGGALRHAAAHVSSSPFIAINGDSWVSQPLEPVLAEHLRLNRSFTVVAVPATNVEGGALNKGVWRVGPKGEVAGFATEELVSQGWVNAGIYILEKSFVLSWPDGSYSLEKNLPTLLNGKEAGVFCSTARLLDIGTPDCYKNASRLLESRGVLT